VTAGGEQWTIEVEIRLFRPRSALPHAAERFWAVVANQ